MSDVFQQIRPFLPTYGHLIFAALLPIFTASHASLRRPANTLSPAEARALRPSKSSDDSSSTDTDDDDDDDENNGSPPAETITAHDAIMFPVTAGCLLGSLYLIIKYLDDPTLLSRILTWYFCGMGVFAVGKAAADGMALVVGFGFPDTFRDQNGRLFRARFDSWKLVGSSEGPVSATATGNTPIPGLKVNKVASKLSWKARRVLRARWVLKATVMGEKIRKQFWIGDVVGPVIGALVVGLYVLADKHWLLTNIMGLSFSYSALQLLSPTTFPIATLLLGLLFFYDVFFVFYTPLMVTVATNLDVPIKLLFPRPGGDAKSLAMLGLGDVVIPGLVVAMALRFDLWRHYELRRQSLLAAASSSSAPLTADAKKALKPRYTAPVSRWGGARFWSAESVSAFEKPYFKASLVGYTAGMVTTLGVMHVFQHAQPALLYLVPGVLGAIWTTALVKGEIKSVWAYSEEAEGEEEEEEKKEKTEEDKEKAEAEKKRKEEEANKKAEEEEKMDKVFLDVTVVRKPAPGAAMRVKKGTPLVTPPSPDLAAKARQDGSEVDSASEMSSDDDIEGDKESAMWKTTVIGKEG